MAEKRKEILRKVLMDRFSDDITFKDVEKDIAEKAAGKIEDYTREHIFELLQEDVPKKQIEEAVNELEKQGFWDVEEPIDQADSYRTEQETLDGYEKQYDRLKRICSGHEPVELVLRRCLIMAFLMDRDQNTIKSHTEEFNRAITYQDVLAQVEKLGNAIHQQDSMNNQIVRYLNHCRNYDKADISSVSPYESLMALKKELIPIDVPDLVQLVEKTKKAKKCIQNKQILLFIGETGSGKTTSIKALLGYKMGIRKYKGMDWVTTVEIITDPTVLAMHSNPGCKSVTRYITASVPKKEVTREEILLADTPGFGDTGGAEIEIANIIGVSEALKGCKSIIPVLVISKESWGPRGTGIKKLAQTIASLFKDYRACKNSVAVIINRFSETEIREMKNRFGDIIEELTAADKVNQNFVKVLNHFEQLAAEGGLINFDPLENRPRLILQNLIDKKGKAPSEMFGDIAPPSKSIRAYQAQVEKRVRYHLSQLNPVMVKYFIDELKSLNSILQDQIISKQIESLKDLVEASVKESYNKIVRAFNQKVFLFSLTNQDIEEYFNEVRKLEKESGFDQLLPDCRLAENAVRNYQDSALKISSEFMQERTNEEEEDGKNQKSLSQLRILVDNLQKDREVQETSRSIEAWFKEKLKRHLESYFARLENEDISAAEEISTYRRYSRYYLIWNEKAKKELDSDSQIMENKLLEHIRLLIEQGNSVIDFVTKANCEKLDKVLGRIGKSQGLLGCQTTKNASKIERLSKDFTSKVKGVVDAQYTSVLEIVSKAKTELIAAQMVYNFEEAFNKLKLFEEMAGVSKYAKRQLEQVKYNLENYLETQKLNLQRVVDVIESNPGRLKNQAKTIDLALNGIEKLAKFGGEQSEQTANAVRKQTLKEIEDTIRKVIGKMEKVPQLSVSSPKADEVIRKMEETYELALFFKNLTCFKDDPNIGRLKDINERNETNLLASLGTASTDLKVLTKGGDNILNLQTVENTLRFINLVSEHCWVDKTREEADQVIQQAKRGFENVSKQISYSIDAFKTKFFELDNEEDLRNLWNKTKKQVQLLVDLTKTSAYPHATALANFDPGLYSQFLSTIETITEEMKKKFSQLCKLTTYQLKLSKLEARCDIFKKQDIALIEEDRFSELTKLKEDINKIIAHTQGSQNERIASTLRNARYEDLNQQLRIMGKENGIQSQVYERAVESIKIHVADKKRKMKQYISELEKKKDADIDLVDLTENYQTLLNIQEVNVLKSEMDGKEKQRFEEVMQRMMLRLVGEIKSALYYEELSTAFKLQEQLARMESSLPQQMKLKDKAESAAGFFQKINDILKAKEILLKTLSADNLRSVEQLALFTQRNASDENQRIKMLKDSWQKTLTKVLSELLQRLKDTKTQKDYNLQCYQIEKIIMVMRNKDGAASEFNAAKADVQRKVKREETNMNAIISSIPHLTRLNYNEIKQVLQFTKTHDNDLLLQLKSKVMAYFKQAIQGYKDHKNTPRKYVEISLNVIGQFITETATGEYGTHLKDICLHIKADFQDCVKEHMQALVAKYKNELRNCSGTYPAVSRTLRSGIITEFDQEAVRALLDELFIAIQTTGHKDVKLSPIFQNAYNSISQAVVKCYGQCVQPLKLDAMFDKNPFKESIQRNVDEARRLAPVMDVIRKHSIDARLPEGIKSAISRLKLDEVLVWSDFVKNFKDRMEKCEQTAKLASAGDKLQIADETELAGELNKVSHNIKCMELFKDIYESLYNVKLDLQELKEKTEQQITSCYNSLLDCIKDLNNTYEEKDLRGINKKFIVLKVAKGSSSEREKQFRQIVNTLETKLQQLAGQCHSSFIEFRLKTEGFKLKSDTNRKSQSAEISQRQSKLEADKKDKFKKREEENSKLIKNEHDSGKKQQLNKQWESQKRSFETELADSLKEIEKKVRESHKKVLDKDEKILRQFLSKFCEELTRLRIIESGIELKSAKEICRRAILSCMADYKKLGKRWFAILAEELVKIGKNEAIYILNEHPGIFTSFNAKKFRDGIENKGEDYIIRKVPGLDKKVQENLKSLYTRYLENFNTQTENYSKNYKDDTILSKLKDLIKEKANEVKQKYKQNINPSSGGELIAYIFALWTIKRAQVDDDDGVEYIYQPHPAQIIAIFLILGLCESQKGILGNRLAEVLTGEGKSIVLAGLSCYLALAGFDVNCMCYSQLLSRRDYQQFEELFRQLNIEKYVRYGTFAEVIEKQYNSVDFDIRKCFEGILLRDEKFGNGGFITFFKNRWKQTKEVFGVVSRKRILLIDEVDVFFNKQFFGKYYAPSIEIKSQCIVKLAIFAWNNRKSINQRELLKSAEYAACVRQYPRLENILQSNVVDIIGSVRNFTHPYIIYEGKIGYVLPEGIVYQALYGWKTVFAYFYEKERGNILLSADQFVSMSILGCELSYAELPKGFEYIMGVTGTLNILPQCQKNVLKQWYSIDSYYLIPSVYGQSRRKKLGAQLVRTQDYNSAVTKAIEAETSKGRPVALFFSTIEAMINFDHSAEFKQLKAKGITMTVSENNDQATIRDRIIRTTRPGNITLFTKAFGRGIDFVLGEKSVKERGGLHVIQTFLSEQESQAIQIEGRTARQGQQGSYELIITEDDLKSIGLASAALSGNASQNADILTSERRSFFDQQYTKQVDAALKCRENHDKATRILKCIAKNENKEVCQLISEINFTPPMRDNNFRLAIGIDATGSMSAALGQVVANMRECIERTYTVLREKSVTDGFELQVALYRNYSSSMEKLLERSPFSSTAPPLITFLKSAQVNGGMGNEAIQVFYNHCLYKQNGVSEIIVIGDAPCNTDVQFAQRRKSKGESYWQNEGFRMPVPSKLVEQLIKRPIKVHSFYIGRGPAAYFQKLSRDTKGEAKEYNYQGKNAALDLTDFIVEKVLNGVGGSKGGDLVTAYRMRFPRN